MLLSAGVAARKKHVTCQKDYATSCHVLSGINCDRRMCTVMLHQLKKTWYDASPFSSERGNTQSLPPFNGVARSYTTVTCTHRVHRQSSIVRRLSRSPCRATRSYVCWRIAWSTSTDDAFGCVLVVVEDKLSPSIHFSFPAKSISARVGTAMPNTISSNDTAVTAEHEFIQ